MNKSKFFYFLFLLTAVYFTSCGNESNKGGNSANTFTNDFKAHFGYNPNVQKGKGHSDQFFYQMDSTLEFSLTFLKNFNQISANSFAKVRFSAFVLLPDQTSSAAVTIQIWDGAGNPLKVESKIANGSEIGLNLWKEVTIEMNLAGLYAPNHEVRCFIHNPLRQTLFVDDMKVEFFQ